MKLIVRLIHPENIFCQRIRQQYIAIKGIRSDKLMDTRILSNDITRFIEAVRTASNRIAIGSRGFFAEEESIDATFGFPPF